MKETSVTHTHSKSDIDNWQIETLFKKAFARTKERFLSYFLTMVMMYAATLGAILIIAIIGVALGFVASRMDNQALVGGIAIVSILVLITAVAYISAWGGLAIIHVLTQGSKPSISESIKAVKPLVWGYLLLQALFGLFIFGLLPFIVLSLGVVAILWSVWAFFLGFIYIEKETRGMAAVWQSKALVDKKFWAITGRLALVTVVLLAIQLGLGFAENALLQLISAIVSLVSTPFIIGYSYELYKNVDSEVEPKKPTGWIIASIVGWIIGGIIIVAGLSAFAKELPKLIEEGAFSPENLKRYQYKDDILPSGALKDNSGQIDESYEL